MIRFRFDPLDSLGDRLEGLVARARFAVAAVEAVNLVTARASESLQRGEVKDINLSPAYVKSKTGVVLASSGGRPRAEITTKGDLTTMGQFGVTMASMRRSGNPVLRAGVRTGRRNSGTAYRVKTSQPSFEPQWFVLPLRDGTLAGGNGFGVFVRDSRIPASKNALREGKAGKRHVYGPSPYQLFKQQVLLQTGEIQDDLAKTALQRMGALLEEAIG